ncbi:MAG: Calcineurin-like protein phosphoesterase family protein, partial [Parcubacteria group bacterium GW2011_GWA1_51_12]
MKVLIFGDIFGRPGREALAKILPQWKKEFAPDLVIANGENLSHGR